MIYYYYLLFFFISIYIYKYFNKIDQIEAFIVVKDYIKKSILVLYLQESYKSQSINKDILEREINHLAKKISKTLINFSRARHILKKLKNMQDFDFFILPDTLLQKSRVEYYKCLIKLSNLSISSEKLESEKNSKLLLEKIYSSSNGKSLS